MLEKHGYLVDGWHIPDDENLLVFDLAEVGNLLYGRGFEFALATASNLALLGTRLDLLPKDMIRTRSGIRPLLLTALMACCVGFVFCSPWMTGTYET